MHSRAYTLTHSLSHTHSRTHARTHTCSHARTHSLSLTYTHTHTVRSNGSVNICSWDCWKKDSEQYCRGYHRNVKSSSSLFHPKENVDVNLFWCCYFVGPSAGFSSRFFPWSIGKFHWFESSGQQSKSICLKVTPQNKSIESYTTE